VGEFIDERRLSHLQIRVFALPRLIRLLDGLDALCMGFLAPTVVFFQICTYLSEEVVMKVVFIFA
jgi:hypothetical protein